MIRVMLLMCYLVVLSIYDIRHKAVPGWSILVGGIFAGINIVYTISQSEGNMILLLPVILLPLIPGLFMLLVGRISGKVGLADGCVLLVVGSVLDGREMYLVFGASLLLSAVFAIVLLTCRRIKGKDKLPYLPFLTAAVLMVLWKYK